MSEIICLCINCKERKVIKGRKYCYTCSDKLFRSPATQEERRLKKNIRMSNLNKRTRSRINNWRKNRRIEKKIEIMLRYGNKCNCCGEDNLGFLTIDHVKNDGHERRKLYTSEGNISDYLFYKEVDLETYQILCFNCNYGKNCNGGVCPHKTVL